MTRLIDLDDDRHSYVGEHGEYENWNIDPDVPAVEAIPIEFIKNLHKEAIEYRDHFDSFWQAPAWDRADNQAIGINSVLQEWEDRHG